MLSAYELITLRETSRASAPAAHTSLARGIDSSKPRPPSMMSINPSLMLSACVGGSSAGLGG